MKYLLLAGLSLLTLLRLHAQSEQVFIVKKPVKHDKPAHQSLFDLNITPGVDTLKGRMIFNLDFTKIYTYYDSIATYNLNLAMRPNHIARIEIATKRWGGHAILQFYKKQKDNSFKLVYIKNWMVMGKRD